MSGEVFGLVCMVCPNPSAWRGVLMMAFAGMAGSARHGRLVIACAVSQQSPEMACRVALGTNCVDVVRVILGESLMTDATGMTIRAALASASRRLLDSRSYEVKPLNASAHILAALIPSLRAARAAPMNALRGE